MTSLGPFDLTGGPFLLLYSMLLLAAFAVSAAAPRWLRPRGQPGMVGDVDSLAYLAGGAARLGDVVMTGLHNAGLVRFGRGSRMKIGAGTGGTSAERAVLALSSPASWTAIDGAIYREAQQLDQRLQLQGLLMTPRQRLAVRIARAGPFAALALFGMVKVVVGLWRDRPVGFLVALIFLTVFVAIKRFAVVDRMTRAGAAALREARHRADRLRRAPTKEEAGLAVALFGSVVLMGSAMSDLHAMRRTGDSSSGGGNGDSGGGSGGDGGSGCGGGGCGGCGGG